MKKRYYKTIEFGGFQYKEAKGVDEAIDGVLGAIALERGPVQLFDFKVFSVETNWVPPRSASYLTVIAEAID